MEILYQDDRVAVCVKPAGVLSTDEPGGMPSLIRRALGDETAHIRGVHRLDRAVGGVMVYARTRRAASDLGRQMEAGRFQKQYLAVVHGCPAAGAGTMADHLHRDTHKKMTYIVPAGSPEARQAVLDYRLLCSAGGLSLMAVRLHTGRTHQIRCQLSGRGLPIVGDKKYGEGEECNIALWAHSLTFFHPRTGEAMTFSRLPPMEHPWGLFSAELEAMRNA